MRIRRINGLVIVVSLVTGLWLIMETAALTAAPEVSNTTTSKQSGTPITSTDNMVLIPAGEFSMGDPYSEGYISERPVHKVYVSDFYMEKYLITGAQWKDVYDWAKVHGYGFDNTGVATADTHPVQKVSWYDVVKWLNARSDKE
ncbi:MAG: formylglycine-generating enzyme family protein, partial [Deltaproteobacteria bacterium]|nr:formylglycine-generating enzyme family protein [Deltaproteobacteria bacterium]